jgi:hypothetical protein
VACRRLWQVGLEHFPGDDEGYGGEDYDDGASEAGSAAGPPRSICNWLKGSTDPQMARGATGLWVNVYDGTTPQPGKVLLFVQKSQRELPPGAEGSRGEEGGPGKGTLKVSSCQAYDYILLAALKSQVRVVPVAGLVLRLPNTATAGCCAQLVARQDTLAALQSVRGPSLLPKRAGMVSVFQAHHGKLQQCNCDLGLFETACPHLDALA